MIKKARQFLFLLTLVFITTAGFVLLNQQSFSIDDPYTDISSAITVGLNNSPVYDGSFPIYSFPNRRYNISILLLKDKVPVYIPSQNQHDNLIFVRNNSPPIIL
jgi:hypothetical protein